MSDDKQYKYVEITIKTPHSEYTETWWARELENDDEYDSLIEVADDLSDMYERFLSEDMGQVTLYFNDRKIILAPETARRTEIYIRLQEDNDGLPF